MKFYLIPIIVTLVIFTIDLIFGRTYYGKKSQSGDLSEIDMETVFLIFAPFLNWFTAFIVFVLFIISILRNEEIKISVNRNFADEFNKKYRNSDDN